MKGFKKKYVEVTLHVGTPALYQRYESEDQRKTALYLQQSFTRTIPRQHVCIRGVPGV